MTTLKPIKSGWKWLEKALNVLIDGINARTVAVSVGGGLDIQETPNGYVLSIPVGTGDPAAAGASGSGDATAKTPDGTTAGWMTIEVFDSNCTPFTMWVWGTLK